MISWELRGQYKWITHTEHCDSYQAALTYAAGLPSSNYNIASDNPFVSPVPLEELTGFALRHDSQITKWSSNTGATIPQVRVFEYVK